jgi:GTPase Era involved in 16S rRNA processing
MGADAQPGQRSGPDTTGGGVSRVPELPAMELAALQADVVAHVTDVATLVGQTLRVLPGESDLEFRSLAEEQAALEGGVLDSVNKLELRLPVVATMKAGKSTLINAIAGFRLLPYRTLPMTTLPTEVVLTNRVAEPRLLFPEDVVDLLRQIADNLTGKDFKNASRSGLSGADKSFRDTLDALLGDGDPVPSSEVHGIDSINAALSRANDLVRIGVMSGVVQDLLSYLRQIPRIECPPQAALAEAVGSGRAELVLVDTPGPNEAGMTMHLFPLIDQELKEAGVVFLVLNFIDMRSQAQDQLRREIEPVLGRLGTDKVYIVVNRFDDRRQEDMTEEETREFAAREAGLRSDDHGRVFLTSARQAFDASSFRRVRNELGEAAWDSPEGHNLGQSAFPALWPKIRASLPPEVLDELPGRIWENSGFETLLVRALADLLQRAGPLILDSAVHHCQGITDQLRHRLRLRLAAVHANVTSLRDQQEALQRDRDEVDKVRKDLEAKSTQRKALEKEIGAFIDQRGGEVRDLVASVLRTGGQGAAADPQAWDGVPAPLQVIGRRVSDVQESLAAMLNQQVKDSRRFGSQDEANSFIARLRSGALAEVGQLSMNLQSEIPRLVKRAEHEVGMELRSRVKPIAEAAQRRIADTFNVALELPVPDFEDMTDAFVFPSHEPALQNVPQPIRQRILKRRWFTLWLFKVPTTEVVSLPGADEYIVDLNDITRKYLDYYDDWLAQIRGAVLEKAGGGFDDSLRVYFRELDQFLERYLASIQEGIDAGRLDRHEKEHLIATFSDILASADSRIDTGQRLLGYIRDFVHDVHDATG